MLWNVVDVRDVARAHRLCAESGVAKNASRYILAARDRSGELFTWQLSQKLKAMYPEIQNIGGEEMEQGKPAKASRDRPRAYCLLAMQELGLVPHPIDETLRATCDSFIRLGLLDE